MPRRLSILAALVGVVVAACAGSPETSTELTSSEVSSAPVDTSATTPSSTEAPTPTSSSTSSTSSTSSSSSSASSPTSAAAGASSSSETTSASTTSETTVAASATSGSATSGSATSGAPTSSPTPAPVPLRLRLDRRVGDEATAGFAELVQAVLTDPRGWAKAGYLFTFDDTDYDYTLVLAEGDEVDSLCLPYDTFGRFSCQIGPVVALNADRWRSAVESWPASLDEYRTMLVNHEVGHLIGQHHPASRCPGAGQPAPVMAQQSSGVDPCTANPWPLPWEIACANLRLEPLAPGYERNITLTCGPDGPIG
ncbi:MAG: DUF3152 domain-containing protein [Actinomycetota bacterium]